MFLHCVKIQHDSTKFEMSECNFEDEIFLQKDKDISKLHQTIILVLIILTKKSLKFPNQTNFDL